MFYAGDYEISDHNSLDFANENTILIPNTSTYGAVLIPRNHAVVVKGILFQVQFQELNTTLDPNGVTWEIRSGITEGSGGVLLASGQGPVAKEATGRAGNGIEYSVRVKVDPPVQLSGGNKGTTYWFNLTPPCVNPNDPDCFTNQYAVSNTTQQANSFRGALQPPIRIYVNSAHYSYDWNNWCDHTENGTQCAYLSFGLVGKVLF